MFDGHSVIQRTYGYLGDNSNHTLCALNLFAVRDVPPFCLTISDVLLFVIVISNIIKNFMATMKIKIIKEKEITNI